MLAESGSQSKQPEPIFIREIENKNYCARYIQNNWTLSSSMFPFFISKVVLSSFLFILTFVSDLFMPKKTCESWFEVLLWIRFGVDIIGLCWPLHSGWKFWQMTPISSQLALLLLIGGELGWASTTLQKNQGISYAHWTKPAFFCLLMWERSKSIINAASTEQLQDTRYNHQKTYC